MKDIRDDLAACRLCAERFAVTATQHRPRPIVWFKPGARLLIASQAPGKRVHEAGKPFWDMSGTRLRDYFRIEDQTGRRFWLYREGLLSDGRGAEPRWFLHGAFA